MEMALKEGKNTHLMSILQEQRGSNVQNAFKRTKQSKRRGERDRERKKKETPVPHVRWKIK